MPDPQNSTANFGIPPNLSLLDMLPVGQPSETTGPGWDWNHPGVRSMIQQGLISGPTQEQFNLLPETQNKMAFPAANLSAGQGYRDFSDPSTKDLNAFNPSAGFVAANQGPGGFFTLRDYYRSRGERVPEIWERQGRADAPSTANYNLLPPQYRQPGYKLQGGMLFGPDPKAGLPAGGYQNTGQYTTSGAAMGFPDYPVFVGSGGGGRVGFPGQVMPWQGAFQAYGGA